MGIVELNGKLYTIKRVASLTAADAQIEGHPDWVVMHDRDGWYVAIPL